MGIKLTDLVEKKPLKWDQLKGKKLAIDAQNVIFQFLSSIRQQDGAPLTDDNGNITSHLIGLFSRVPNLMQKGITPIFVFDGEAPELKENIRIIRRKTKAKAKENYIHAKEEEDFEQMHKYSRQLSVLNEDMIEESKELLNALGLPTVQAPSEAEAQCAHMCKKKIVWATASQDFDTLLFGSPKLIQNLTLAKTRKFQGRTIPVSPQLIELNELLDKLELNQEELIVLGIMVGTDFNPKGIKGIGPKKALKLLQSGKKFERIFEELETDFDWEEILNIFKNIPIEDEKPKKQLYDSEKIKEILIERHDFSEERVDKTLSKINNKENSSLKRWF
ncbi:flap endonuclease-1 [archaeon]|nr:flap endonuclease-1 [archaeon]MBT5288161.1 flap endonuclease-1 [archaeon]MBT7053156.1 flap endonuclease-1 [archaeon]MBT7281152.1 flap endonuclease-1 [archaeon]MBT8010524.1 flap endonuclease-1 [archaeon]